MGVIATMADRKVLTAGEMAAQMDDLFDASGLRMILGGQADRLAALGTALALVMQDVTDGPARQCMCVPCDRLRVSLESLEGLLDVIFGR